MMKISNLSVYKLLGYLLLGIGAYAVLSVNNTNLQANSAVTQQQTTYKRAIGSNGTRTYVKPKFVI